MDSYETVTSVREIPRCAACVTFTQDEQFVVLGEKSGNVYKLSIPDLTTEGDQPSLDLMLGHLSILSDIAVSYDGKLLATCDRDEKIRISRFQQPFVIEAFCLGHSWLGHCEHKMPFSIGAFERRMDKRNVFADGYLRLWQSETGTELSSIQLTLDGETKKVEAEENSLSVVNPIIIHRLFIAETDICVCSSSSKTVEGSVLYRSESCPLSQFIYPLFLPVIIIIIDGNIKREHWCFTNLQVVNPIPESLLKLPGHRLTRNDAIRIRNKRKTPYRELCDVITLSHVLSSFLLNLVVGSFSFTDIEYADIALLGSDSSKIQTNLLHCLA
ncbi:tRNA (guanine-N(7)-)-methyltransferase subunit WDR4 [Clonorchis sinensis]|uniref:tRNA (Guanine-N(7)-)-methyltransferase subunit WDR4 n=1 Tax=Clonorchis sinensis TaxID=79923 RepID=G7Y3A2_CLOSI|nr:tRNA (guanine-N(7)-)-methyltransferase subunit WDR4 [Clonorchis sinensis]